MFDVLRIHQNVLIALKDSFWWLVEWPKVFSSSIVERNVTEVDINVSEV
jgi:hypothetical protein